MCDIASLEVVDPATGRVLVRNGVTLAFFVERAVHECGEALRDVLDAFLSSVPNGSLKWAVPSGTSEDWRPLGPSVLERIHGSLSLRRAARNLTAFRLNDAAGAAPRYGFTLADRYRDKPDSMLLVQMTLPIDAAASVRADATVELACRVAALLSPVAGYCAPALAYADAQQTEAFERLRGLALRYPGYDVAMNDLTRMRIGRRVRGARWVTVLGPTLVGALGGPGALRSGLPADVEIRQAGTATILRAGRTPEVGDSGACAPTPLLRAVARLLEPVTWFRETKMLLWLANFDDELLARWERRFLD